MRGWQTWLSNTSHSLKKVPLRHFPVGCRPGRQVMMIRHLAVGPSLFVGQIIG